MEGAGAEQPSAQAAFLDAVHLPAFSAAATFNRAEHTQEVAGADLVVMGVQFDLGAVNRPGARFGPRAIRQQSIYAGALSPIYPWDEDLRDAFRVVDHGDVVVIPGSGAVETMIEQTQTAAAAVFRSGASLLALGGDHTLPYGLVRAAAEKFGPLALIHLDSHQGSVDGAAVPGGGIINHGTFATGWPGKGTSTRRARRRSTYAQSRTTRAATRSTTPRRHGSSDPRSSPHRCAPWPATPRCTSVWTSTRSIPRSRLGWGLRVPADQAPARGG